MSSIKYDKVNKVAMGEGYEHIEDKFITFFQQDMGVHLSELWSSLQKDAKLRVLDQLVFISTAVDITDEYKDAAVSTIHSLINFERFRR